MSDQKKNTLPTDAGTQADTGTKEAVDAAVSCGEDGGQNTPNAAAQDNGAQGNGAQDKTAPDDAAPDAAAQAGSAQDDAAGDAAGDAHARKKRRRPFARKQQARPEPGKMASGMTGAVKMGTEKMGSEKMGPIRDPRSLFGGSEKLPALLPVVPLRDVVLFNFMIIPLFISRESSVAAMDQAVESGPPYVLALTQKNGTDDEPGPDDVYQIGTVVQVLRILKMPDNRLKALVQGVARARVRRFDKGEKYLTADVEYLQEPAVIHDATVEAMLRLAREHSEKILAMRGLASPDLMKLLHGVDDPGRMADLVAANLRMRVDEAQKLLETIDPVERLKQVTNQLQHEVEVAQVQMRIQSSAREGIDKAQKDYILREQLKAIRHELGDSEDSGEEELDKLKEALEKAGLPEDVKKEADKQLRRLKLMHSDAAEANLVRTYLETLSELPWQTLSEDNLDIANAQKTLDEDHYGLDKIKDRILEFLSVRKLNPETHGSILCFVGPPGVGKTSLGKSVARALGRKFERLSLGGMHDEAEIRGHRRTYIGAMPGRIIQALKHAGTRNPVIVLDEIDKVGKDFRGDPQSALLEVLDPEQNNTFSDHYLNVPFDLSKVMFLCTANQLETIPSALRDRMEIIRLPGYTMQEKEVIAERYLVKKRLEDNGLDEKDVKMGADAIEGIIQNYTREAGVRELERQIGSVCRKLARKKAEGRKGPFRVRQKDLQGLLGPARFLDEDMQESLLPGMAYGLAWTQAGGEVLTIETSILKGKGKIQLTGSLGDVMKESAHAAFSYLRSNAETFGVPGDFDSKTDVHVHVPDGATPKDGPSAGVTLTTALLSALKKTPVRSDLCMTGEIDIKGRVLPVGGIKEKLLGAMARGLKKAVIPWQNQKDLVDIPKDLREKLEIVPVRHYSEVYELAFLNDAALSSAQTARALPGEEATNAAAEAGGKASPARTASRTKAASGTKAAGAAAKESAKGPAKTPARGTKTGRTAARTSSAKSGASKSGASKARASRKKPDAGAGQEG